jgi:hypothetical protein
LSIRVWFGRRLAGDRDRLRSWVPACRGSIDVLLRNRRHRNLFPDFMSAKTTPKPNRPSTAEEWSAYRATLSCQIGIEVMQGDRKPPAGVTPEQWGLYNLLHAVKALAEIHLPNID